MTITAADLYIKHGATLQLLFGVQNDDGSPYDLTTVVATSQVRDTSNALIATLTLATTGTPGQLSITQDTASWPQGRFLVDVKLVSGGITLKSQTFGLLVDQAITA